MAYSQTKFSLTENQIHKIANAVKDGTDVTLRLSKGNMNKEGYNLPLTKTQINKLNDGAIHDLEFSVAQIKFIQNKIKKHSTGGLLPLALIPIIAAALGGVGTVAGTVATAVQKSQANRDRKSVV